MYYVCINIVNYIFRLSICPPIYLFLSNYVVGMGPVITKPYTSSHPIPTPETAVVSFSSVWFSQIQLPSKQILSRQ